MLLDYRLLVKQSSTRENALRFVSHTRTHVPTFTHASACVLLGTGLYIQPRVSRPRAPFPFVSILLLSHTSTYVPLLAPMSTCAHTDAHPRQALTFALDLCSILQRAKPNKPIDTILIPIIFLRIGLQICSLNVVCQAGEGYPINGEEGSREQPEKSGVKLTFWREPSTHSYY